MKNPILSNQANDKTKPLVLLIAKQVEEPKATGEYSYLTDTWTNRKYEFSPSKKHNEEM